MWSIRRLSLVVTMVATLCLSGCGNKEATPDKAGKKPGDVALEIMKMANEGKFEEVRKLMTPDLVSKIEARKMGPQKTIKDFLDLRTRNQTITNMEVLESKPGKTHPWRVDVKAHYADGSSRSRVGFAFELEDGLWKMTN